jgi:hypothetical protein
MGAVPRSLRFAAVAAAVTLALAGCSGDEPKPRASATPSVPPATLPPGDLVLRVLQPGEVSPTLVPIAAQTGARDITSIAAFSADPKAAQKTLQAHGFQSAYVVQYADPAASSVITSVATKFSTAGGATEDMTADLAAAKKTGTSFEVTGLGDQAGGVRGRFDPKAAVGTLVTLRWRAGNTTWLLAVGSKRPVDEQGVRALADRLMARVAKGTD